MASDQKAGGFVLSEFGPGTGPVEWLQVGWSQQAFSFRQNSGLGARFCPQCPEYAGHMASNRVLAHVQGSTNLFVGVTFAQLGQHLDLSRCQVVGLVDSNAIPLRITDLGGNVMFSVDDLS